MNPSIRKYLLIRLLFLIGLIILAGTLIYYYISERSVETHLDNRLKQFALLYHVLLDKTNSSKYLVYPQQDPSEITIDATELLSSKDDEALLNLDASKFELLVWDKDNNLILRTAKAPNIKSSDTKDNMFSHYLNEENDWLVYSLRNPKNGLTVATAENFNNRRALSQELNLFALYLLVITYAIIALLTWFFVSRGLRTIDLVTKEVRYRAPNFLKPVDIQNIPVEIKPLIDELNKLFLRLRQAFEREKAFSSNAAHELRTPIAALKTQAQVALKATTKNQYEATLKKLIASVDRSTHVVEQLLTLSRLLPDSNLHEAKNINFSTLTAEIIAHLAPSAIDKNIDIELIGGDKAITARVIPAAISILLRNLVDNAIRYTPEGGKVQVCLEQANQSTTLKVVDDGPGIAPELRSRVFERFYRVLGAKSPGSGLGLAIVQEIADLHQATITLGTPADGVGLEVIITFPHVFC